MSFKVMVPALIAAFAAAGSAHAAGDAEKGKTAFSRCAICHATEPGVNKVGPSLAGIIGRKPGSDPKFSYSEAMKNDSQVWDEKTLDDYLANPRQAVPGTKMVFAGVKNQSDRDDIIAYLATLK